MKINLIRKDENTFSIVAEDALMGMEITRKKGESDSDFEERAVKEFDAHITRYNDFKESLSPKIIKSAHV